MISRNYVFIIMGLCLVTGIFFAGCTQQSTPAQTTTTIPTTAAVQSGIANPASVYCGQTGGTIEIMKNTDGSEYGMCKFTNGTSCEEWALFRGEGCKPGVAKP